MILERYVRLMGRYEPQWDTGFIHAWADEDVAYCYAYRHNLNLGWIFLWWVDAGNMVWLHAGIAYSPEEAVAALEGASQARRSAEEVS